MLARLSSMRYLIILVGGLAACSNNQAALQTPNFPQALTQVQDVTNTQSANFSGNVQVDTAAYNLARKQWRILAINHFRAQSSFMSKKRRLHVQKLRHLLTFIYHQKTPI